MLKSRKLIKSASLVLLGIILVGAALILAADVFGDGTVQVAIENAGMNALKTPVTIDRTRLSVLSGALSLDDMTIDSPAGYRHRIFLTLKHGAMRVKPLSLLGDKVMIHNLTLDGLDVIVEPNGTGSNLQDILNALHNAHLSDKSLYVSNLEITNITVNMALPSEIGPSRTIPLKLSPIRMTDLGRNERMDMAALAHRILAAIAGRIAEQSGQLLPKGGVLDKAVDLGRALIGLPTSTAAEDPNRPLKPQAQVP